jgi:hypothetical protein
VSRQYVVVSSITYAYKGKNVLERKGIRASIERAPASISSCGCHYVIKFGNVPMNRVIQLLNEAHIKIISTGGAYDYLP